MEGLLKTEQLIIDIEKLLKVARISKEDSIDVICIQLIDIFPEHSGW